MEQKKLITIGMIMGGIAGGYLPTLWDTNMFSLSGVIFSALGGFLGIWVGYKLGE